ncbi:MAG TPA: HAD hydrolase family protein [Phycisphaerae bacterium]|nr:HAD hydrolase family protein [Phycisphaerae bacterium]
MAGVPTALICLDLDGTSVEHDGTHVWFSEEVARAINEATHRGAAWCANSGRSADNQMGIIQACRELEILPTAILSGERYIHDFHPTGFALMARQPDNDLAKQKARDLAPRAKAALEPELPGLEARFGPAEWHPRAEFVAWLLADACDHAAFAEEVQRLLQDLPDAQVLRNGRWVVVTHADFGKGRVLGTLAGGLGVPRERVLAVGDQPNDLDMLDGRVAAYVGCPLDADGAIVETVSRVGGWVADQPATAGTAALIRRFAREALTG